MADYIKRDSVTNLIKLMEYPNGVIECYADEFISDINAIPSADVAPVKHGRWEKQIQCSECGWYFEDDVLIEPILVFFNYCPNCGARIDGE